MRGESWSLQLIGHFRVGLARKYELPRQACESRREGRIELAADFDGTLLGRGLEGFKKIWVVYGFHQNHRWKSLVQPQNSAGKVGVWASRAPYRPNFLGLSCLDLLRVTRSELLVRGVDALEGSPVFDIKPYLSYADAFSAEESRHANCWWQTPQRYAIEWSPQARCRAEWLKNRGAGDLYEFVDVQLRYQPEDSRHKRIRRVGSHWQLAYRTWRVIYSVEGAVVTVHAICSGYEAEELSGSELQRDPYGDKLQHLEFSTHSFGEL